MPVARDTWPASLPFGVAPRTLYVTGKGGVGKTTVAAVTALAYASAGVRTLLVELDGHEGAGDLISDRPLAYDPVVLAPNLHGLRIDPASALKEYARMQLKVKLVADRLVGNPVVRQFAEAAPGFDDVLVLGKVWKLASEGAGGHTWDAVIVDAPATGHGVGLLTMVSAVAEALPVGLISQQARQIHGFVQRPDDFGVVLVTLPEELPVTEALDLQSVLAGEQIHTAAVVVNGVLPARFSPKEVVRIERLARRRAHGWHDVLAVALDEIARVREQGVELARLRAGVGGFHELPFRFSERFGRADVRALETAAAGLEAVEESAAERRGFGAAR